jgi:hypothetical protein
MFETGIVVALILLGVGMRSFCNVWLHRIGLLMFVAATFMAGFFLGGNSVWLGLLFLAIWPCLPLVEIIWRIRRMDFPLRAQVAPSPAPGSGALPDLEEMTEEFRKAGFHDAEDLGWQWHGSEHFMRVLYHPESKVRASIMASKKPRVEINYVSLSSDVPSGQTLVSWTFPLSYPLRFPPELLIHKICQACDVEDLVQQHQDFVGLCGWEPGHVKPQDPEGMIGNVQKELGRQVDYNLQQGLIEKHGSEHFRYSWRGCFFLWLRTLGDMMRFL